MAEEKKDCFKGKSISATKGGKVVVTKPNKAETEKTLEFASWLFAPPKEGSPGRTNATKMSVSCVCGKPLMLDLQIPSPVLISWGAFCTSCRWRVTVGLTR